jgi:uncharacterized membrane protein SpoIIM required for sporulation
MQETEFIAQNKEKWQEFEQVLNSENKDPNRLTNLFIETTDDLSYSRTFYPNRSVRVYLNLVSLRVHQQIYKNKSKGKNKFKTFWQRELPEALWHSRKLLLFAFALFSFGIFVGVMSSIFYPDFADIVLSPGYVEMTQENINSNDPMAVYKDSEPVEMFGRIAINNIMISFGCFVLGLLWGVGTTMALLSNGIMFGSFMHFFFSRNLAKESILTVMQHGTLELSMIVLSGAAGFILARGVLFPGTYSRIDSLIMSARNAIKIMIAVFVLLVYAAFIESFVTRLTELPDVVRALSILLSLIIVVGYFVIYPHYLNRKGHIRPTDSEETPVHKDENIELNTIKTPSRIFIQTFRLFANAARPVAWISFALSILFILYFGYKTSGQFHTLFQIDQLMGIARNPFLLLWCWLPYVNYISTEDYTGLIFILSLAMAFIALISYAHAEKLMDKKTSSISDYVIRFLNAFCISVIAISPILLDPWVTFFLMIVIWPFSMIWMINSFESGKIFVLTLFSALRQVRHGFWKMLAVFSTVHLMQWFTILLLTGIISILIGLVLTGSPVNLMIYLFQFIAMNVPQNAPYADQLVYIFYTGLLWFVLPFVASLSIYSAYLLYFSLRETSEAQELRTQINKIGTIKRAYGLEKEI